MAVNVHDVTLALVTLRCTAHAWEPRRPHVVPLVCYSAVLIRSASPDRARVERFTGFVLRPPFPFSFSSVLVAVFTLFPNEPFAMQLNCAGHVQDEGGPRNSVMHWLGSGRWDPVWERWVRARPGWLLTLCSCAACAPAHGSIGDAMKGFADESVTLLAKYRLWNTVSFIWR